MPETLVDFEGVTEVAGDSASEEQLQRMVRRYFWAGERIAGADVLEVACGAGQGLGYMARIARRVVGGDISSALVATARKHYGTRIEIHQFDAEALPFEDRSFDVVVIFEAIYYIRNINRFIGEVRRVLRPSGKLLIASANKDLFDFTPSPHSIAYYGVCELNQILQGAGFSVSFFGDTPLEEVSVMQRVLRPIKKVATATGLMPTSKLGKALIKRFVFGKMSPLPAEIEPAMDQGKQPSRISSDTKDTRHKVILVDARLPE